MSTVSEQVFEEALREAFGRGEIVDAFARAPLAKEQFEAQSSLRKQELLAVASPEEDAHTEVAARVHEARVLANRENDNKGWALASTLVLGILLVVGGALALILPKLQTWAWVLAIPAVLILFTGWQARKASRSMRVAKETLLDAEHELAGARAVWRNALLNRSVLPLLRLLLNERLTSIRSTHLAITKAPGLEEPQGPGEGATEPVRFFEAASLLKQRIIGIPEPFILLCYTLSGGRPDELLTIARQMMAVRGKGIDEPLSLIARATIEQCVRPNVEPYLTELGRVGADHETPQSMLDLRRLTDESPTPDLLRTLAENLKPEIKPDAEFTEADRIRWQQAAYFRHLSVVLRLCANTGRALAILPVRGVTDSKVVDALARVKLDMVKSVRLAWDSAEDWETVYLP
ncbi:hypothetical protein D5S17_30715 [Pseudonocardiaceae bacterium YIM PH 21723]|nr:hypothetical protein D5S17_30715 [Pseudonocardiaceae bacterium YIM PH 21723]